MTCDPKGCGVDNFDDDADVGVESLHVAASAAMQIVPKARQKPRRVGHGGTNLFTLGLVGTTVSPGGGPL